MMKVPTGFLVVRTPGSAARGGYGAARAHYHGVDRGAPFNSDDEGEKAAVFEALTGDYIDPESNLIAGFDSAAQLFRLFTSSTRAYDYELIYCCSSSDAAQSIRAPSIELEDLGYDVANILVGYWSIVGALQQPSGQWATQWRARLNRFGLFDRKEEAETYLREYIERREQYHDDGFDVAYVVRLILATE